MSDKIDPKHISILWATADHAVQLAPMHARLFDSGWSESAFLNLLSQPTSTAFVAQIGNPHTTIGFVIGRLAADEAEILTLGVAPEVQRRGVGQLLVEALKRAAKQAEAKRMFLEVAASNEAAIELYSALNFKETGRRNDYYAQSGGTREDALILAVDL